MHYGMFLSYGIANHSDQLTQMCKAIEGLSYACQCVRLMPQNVDESIAISGKHRLRRSQMSANNTDYHQRSFNCK